jgi:large conductance mechanosensitive channel
MGTEEAKTTEQTAPVKKEKRRPIRKFFSDFKAFISKGNIVNLAVAVVIGAAFGAIVTSLVNDIVMPLISLAVGKDLLASLRTEIVAPIVSDTGEILKAGTYVEWGKFIQTIINFLIIAFVIFLILRLLLNAQTGLSKMQKKLKKAKKADGEPAPEAEAEPEPEPAKIESTEDILKDIRALLAAAAPKTEQREEASANASADASEAV